MDNVLPVHASERFVVWQREKGAEGTEHLQGYIELHAPIRLSAMVEWLRGAHFEPRRGTRDQARDYCMKEDSRLAGPWERGDFDTGKGWF